MSIYQPDLEMFHVTLWRNKTGDFFYEDDKMARILNGQTKKASKRDKKRLAQQLLRGIKTNKEIL